MMLARRKRLGLVAVVLVMGALIGEVRCAEKKGGEAAQVTCGSVIALQGNKVGTQVACQEVAYGGHGSGQMACTGVTSVADLSRYFTVKGVQGEECLQGTPVTKGMKIRLQNKATGRWLHSHKFRSMLSKSQEVSCFGGPGESDDSDVWKVTWSGGGKFWSNGDKVRAKRSTTTTTTTTRKRQGEIVSLPFLERHSNLPSCRSRSQNTGELAARHHGRVPRGHVRPVPTAFDRPEGDRWSEDQGGGDVFQRSGGNLLPAQDAPGAGKQGGGTKGPQRAVRITGVAKTPKE